VYGRIYENLRPGLSEEEKKLELPDTETLKPKQLVHNWKVVGVGYTKTGIPVTYLTNEQGTGEILVMDTNRLAFVLKYLPEAKLQTGEIGRSTSQGVTALMMPLAFVVDGEIKGLAMPIHTTASDKIVEFAKLHPAEGGRYSTPKIKLAENAAVHAWYDDHPKKDKMRVQPRRKKATRKSAKGISALGSMR